jgi:dienelactone hydrolase
VALATNKGSWVRILPGDGAVRHDIDPWRQIADWRRAISFLEALPEVDAARIGVWGTSYAGGHVLVLGATDRRIRAVVSHTTSKASTNDRTRQRQSAPSMEAIHP